MGSAFAPAAQQEGNPEAAKIAREASQAAKDQNWDKAIDGFRKAAEKDRKFTASLALAYQQRAFAYANDNRFQDAMNDLDESIKIKPDPRAFEQRAAIEMRINDNDKALADYAEASKLNSGRDQISQLSRLHLRDARRHPERDDRKRRGPKDQREKQRSARSQGAFAKNPVPKCGPDRNASGGSAESSAEETLNQSRLIETAV